MPSVLVRPNSASATHQLSLSGAGRTWGLRLERGAHSIVESPIQPSNVKVTGGADRFGDFDPSFSQIEIRDWTGGRGNEFYSDDPTGYYDGPCWSLTPGVLHQPPQWVFGEGYIPEEAVFMPGSTRAGASVKWLQLLSTNHYARSWLSGSTTLSLGTVQMWVRRVGQPPPLNMQVRSSGVDQPGTTLLSTLLNSTSVEEYVSAVWNATLSTAVALSSAANSWIEIWNSSAGTPGSYWEVGYNSSAATNSTAMSAVTTGTWTASTYNLFFRAAPTRTRRNWHFFRLGQALYAVEETAAGSTGPRCFINGDRGIASSVSPGSTAVLNDSTKAWTASQWVGATIMITRGTGAGQFGTITANGTTSITSTWTIAPSTDSEYVIYDTNRWTQLSTTIFTSAADIPVRDVETVGNIAYFAKGASSAVGKLTWNSSLHQAAVDGSNVADVLDFFNDPSAGPQLYRAISSVGIVSRASTNGFTSALIFTSGVTVGSTEYRFTNLKDYNDQMYAFKEDSLWTIKNDRAGKLNIGLDAHISSNNGRAMLAQNLFLYLSWSHSLERLYSGSLDDIGPWRGAGLKSGHQGPFSDLSPIISWTAGGIDAGSTGRSAVMLWNNRGWHEIFRAYSTGYQLGDMYLQTNAGVRPRLWMSVGGELISLQLPKDTLTPKSDRGMNYHHEFVAEMATIDMNNTQLPKLFGSVSAHTKGLGSTVGKIYVEYQLDDEIGGSSWVSIGSYYRSPADTLSINRGDQHSIRLRARGVTEISTTPSEMYALTLKAVSRTPVKRQWTVRAKFGDFQVDAQGMQDLDPDDFYMFMQDAAVTATPLLMRSVWEAMDNIHVYVEPPSIARDYHTPEGEWGGNATFVLREI